MMSSKLDDLPLEERLSDAASIPNKTKADLLKIINPTRKTLSSWESKLILGVLDECINQMEIASLLRTLLNCPEALSPSLGKEVVSALKEHHRLEEKYQAMVLDVSLEQKEQLAKSAKAIQDSFRNIVRLIRGTQTTREVLKPIEPNTGGEMGLQNLKDGLCKFREVVLERLLRTPTEEREHGEMILKVSLRHSANQAVMDSLDKEIAMAIKAKETEISMLNNKVQQLRSSLHQMEKSLEESVVRTQQDAEKQSQSEKKTSEGKRARMQQEANQLRAQLNNVISENRESEMKLRKKKYKEETEIENLIQKYDAEMGEKQTELEEITCMHEKDETELTGLEELFAAMNLEYSQIMKERQEAQEKRRQQEKEREIQSQAATIIQAHWRGFCVRKAMKASAKPKKGKKGKGKKQK
ncbi:dynein regulatory complex protein 10 [Pimephales promelas]|uniref:dynein regulatory complex protein 10 n=1 Tax=Pimephales promelas TaxID=90988 RepID=UPI001955989B|nr:dynein regulatory complex protein 10 [Pimephales promelas]KAG1958334.1 dynein regulatory complex protein [Pimephales promelas]